MKQVSTCNSILCNFSTKFCTTLGSHRNATELVTKHDIATKKKLSFLHSKGRLVDVLKAIGMSDDDAEMLLDSLA